MTHFYESGHFPIMKKEPKRRIISLVADMSTGEISAICHKTYDLRFFDERKFLHDQLDKYLNRLRDGYDNITFEVQCGHTATELSIPF